MRITACLKLNLHLMGEEGDIPGKSGVLLKDDEEGNQKKRRPKEEDKKQLIHLTLSIRTSSEISEYIVCK